MTESKVSRRSRRLTPKPISGAITLCRDDLLRFQVSAEGGVILEKASPTGDGAFATFSEWNSEEDVQLYRGL